MKYLVVRSDALRNAGTRAIRTSEIWPSIVDAESHEDAVRQVYDIFCPGSRLPLNRPFTVVPMENAVEVVFKPIQDYRVQVRKIY